MAAVVMLAGRIALPFVVKHLVNDRLEKIPGYISHDCGVGSAAGA